MSGIFSRWQPRYAERGIATFPVTAEKTPATKGYLRTGIPGSTELAEKFQHADAFGFACGRHNNITLADVDTADERVLADALKTYGNTPVISRTASGGFHAWYRHNGERRQIRRIPNVPVDILGGGYAVAPPSHVAKGTYEFIQGGLDDLDNLRPMVSIGAISEPPSRGALQGMREHDGRNKALFRAIGPSARDINLAGGTREQLLHVARQLNAQCAEPMEDKEVNQIVDSVWGMTLDGYNFIGRPGAFMDITDLDRMVSEDQDALILLLFLRGHQSPRATFMCANRLAERFGWRRQRLSSARRRLIERGYIKPLRQAGRGVPALFRWAYPY